MKRDGRRKRTTARALAFAGWFAFLAGAAPALAGEPTEREKQTAKQLVLEGDQFYEHKDYASALERYRAAYRLVTVPTLGIEVAKAQEALGYWAEARSTALQVARLPRQDGEPPVFERARQRAAAMAQRLEGKIEPAPSPEQPAASQAQPLPRLPAEPGASPSELSPAPRSAQQPSAAPAPLAASPESSPSPARAFTSPATAAPNLEASAAPQATGEPARRAAPVGADQSGARSNPARTRGIVATSIAGAALAWGAVAGIRAFQTKPDCPSGSCAPSQREDLDTSITWGYVADVSVGVGLLLGAYGVWQLVASGSSSETAELPSPAPLAVRVAGVAGAPLSLELAGDF